MFSTTSPLLTLLNSRTASECVRSWQTCPFTARISSPALSWPLSMACPLGMMLLMKIPRAPRGLSAPPTMVNPRDFLPGPLAKATDRNVHWELVLVRRGRVQKFEGDFLLWSLSMLTVILVGSTGASQIFSFDCDFSLSLSSSQRFEMLMAHSSGLSNLLTFDLRGFFIVLNFVSFFSILRKFTK